MYIMVRDYKKKEDLQDPLNLNTILDLDLTQTEPKGDPYESDNDEEIILTGYTRLDEEKEIKLRQALDLLKSLKPNDELINAINLIESVLKREI